MINPFALQLHISLSAVLISSSDSGRRGANRITDKVKFDKPVLW